MKKLLSLVLALVCVLSISALAETAYSGIEGEIYWIGKMYEGDGWMAITDGAKLAGKELGVKFNQTYPEGGEIDVAGQIALVENAINAGAAAIVLAPNDSSALVDVCKRACEANIPVIMYDTALADASYQKAFVSYDFYKQGAIAAEALGEQLGGAGTVAIINATAGNEAHMNRENGFIDTLKEKYPGIEIVGDVQYCNNDSNVAMNMATDLMTNYPDLSAIYAANSMCVEGVAPAVAANPDSKVKVVACDTSDAIVQYVNDGVVTFTSTCSASAIGYLSMVVTAKILAGEDLGDIEWDGKTFTLNTETMTYDTGLVPIDAEVVKDETQAYKYHPLQWFDVYQGTQW